MKTAGLMATVLSLTSISHCAIISRRNEEIQKRQGPDFFASAAEALGTFRSGGAGKVPDPPGALPRRQELASDFTMPGAKRVKIRSGPYRVPNMGVKSLSGHSGMLEGYLERDAKKPCSQDECSLLKLVAGIEYANGSVANINTGMWLHHMVLMNTGDRRWDAMGVGTMVCTPFLFAGTTPSKSERFFVSGNERTPLNYYQGDKGLEPSAYHIDAGDSFRFILELMNMSMEDQVVYVTQTYDIIDGPLPAGWKDIKSVFLDVKSCLDSEVHPPGSAQFTLESKPWTPIIEGKVVYIGGHVHDGGLHVDVMSNPSEQICRSAARYSEKPEFSWSGMEMRNSVIAKDHVSSMVGCEPKLEWDLKRDQKWVIKAQYDFSQRQGNQEDGKYSSVMGVAMMLIAVPPGVVEPIR